VAELTNRSRELKQEACFNKNYHPIYYN